MRRPRWWAAPECDDLPRHLPPNRDGEGGGAFFMAMARNERHISWFVAAGWQIN